MNFESLRYHIVDILYKDKFHTAYVRDIKGKKLHLLFSSGKEEQVSHSALLSVGKDKLESNDLIWLQQKLLEKHDRRERLKEEYNLQEIWEVVRGEVEKINASELASLFLGREPDDDELASFMRKVVEEKLYFKYEGPDLIKVRTPDEVKAILYQREKELERIRLIQEGDLVITALLTTGEIRLSPDKRDWWVRNLINYVTKKEPYNGGKILEELLQKHNLRDPYKLAELLIKNKLAPVDWFFELEREGFPCEFTKEEKEETERVLTIKTFQQHRVDFTGMEVFTVDAEETEDFDDALSVEFLGDKLKLYVHIAEVCQYVKPGSVLWKGALERASTLYLPERVIPMFPFGLSHQKFSLREGEIKQALTFIIEMDGNGEASSFEIYPSVIKISKRYTYDEVDEYLKSGDPFWSKLYRILMKHKEKRYRAGAFAIILPEINLRVRFDDEIEFRRFEMTPSRDLIAEAMIISNYHAAKFLIERNIPGIFRSQREPFQVIDQRESSLFHQILQLKFMAKSELTLQPAFHSGLGLEYYTTQTSPIRRFIDLLIQYQIESYLLNSHFISEEELQKMLPEIQNNTQRAQNLQNRRKKYYLLKYIQRYVKDTPLLGIVMEVQQRKAKVYLPYYNTTGEMVGVREGLSPGEEINVMVDKVNPFFEVLRLRPA